jgi:hypothetical protein
MNNNLILSSVPIRHIELCLLPPKKQNKVVSKHFTNLSMCLPKINYALLNWLLYQSDVVGEFRYSTVMIRRFMDSVKLACEHYGFPDTLQLSMSSARYAFKDLIEWGLVVKMEGKRFRINSALINPKRNLK